MEKKVGKYIIEDELGSGAFGTVYCVRDSTGKKLAAKIFKAPGNGKIEINDVKEVEIHLKLDHSYIVKAYEAFECDNNTKLAIIMELCDTSLAN